MSVYSYTDILAYVIFASSDRRPGVEVAAPEEKVPDGGGAVAIPFSIFVFLFAFCVRLQSGVERV